MAGEKIMIVDDNKEFLEELKDMLVLGGYSVTAITDGATALRVARTIRPDVILLDLKMNKMNGFQVADRLKDYSETSVIPIIAMTAFFTKEEHSSLIRFCGMQKCLKKPFNPLDVIMAIESAIG
jgi:CheY-like chemotaxis protein